jgi:hypothetical protein
MNLIYDGLHQLHLLYKDTSSDGKRTQTEMLFDNKDTDELALFLYPRACAILANRTRELLRGGN